VRSLTFSPMLTINLRKNAHYPVSRQAKGT
jgi:hypothetical protein